MIIAVDFDGTIVENAYPEIGEPLPGAIETLQAWKQRGHTIIINSCRAGAYQAQMEAWLVRNNVAHDYINENAPERIAQYGCDCRKISADIYIDDKNVECLGYHTITKRSWWFGYEQVVIQMEAREKVKAITGREASNYLLDDIDIILEHDLFKIPTKRSDDIEEK